MHSISTRNGTSAVGVPPGRKIFRNLTPCLSIAI